VNCATTIDLKPSALLPSACIPHIPKTERSEMLKIYGDAEVTESVCSSTSEPVTVGSGSLGELDTLYLNCVVPLLSEAMTSLTTN